ncbi:MAG: PAS domain-containing protein, partial [bacterium]
MVVFDRDVRITFWNKAMEEISGRSAEEVLGQVFYDIFPHLIEKGANGPHKSVIKGLTVMQTNVPYLTPKGEARYTNQKFLPLKG